MPSFQLGCARLCNQERYGTSDDLAHFQRYPRIIVYPDQTSTSTSAGFNHEMSRVGQPDQLCQHLVQSIIQAEFIEDFDRELILHRSNGPHGKVPVTGVPVAAKKPSLLL